MKRQKITSYSKPNNRHDHVNKPANKVVKSQLQSNVVIENAGFHSIRPSASESNRVPNVGHPIWSLFLLTYFFFPLTPKYENSLKISDLRYNKYCMVLLNSSFLYFTTRSLAYIFSILTFKQCFENTSIRFFFFFFFNKRQLLHVGPQKTALILTLKAYFY